MISVSNADNYLFDVASANVLPSAVHCSSTLGLGYPRDATGSPTSVPTRPKRQRELHPEFDRVYAGSSGVFQGMADQGDILRKGQLIGRITDLDGTVLEEIHSPIDGLVHELLVRRVVFQGDLLYNLVQFAS